MVNGTPISNITDHAARPRIFSPSSSKPRATLASHSGLSKLRALVSRPINGATNNNRFQRPKLGALIAMTAVPEASGAVPSSEAAALNRSFSQNSFSGSSDLPGNGFGLTGSVSRNSMNAESTAPGSLLRSSSHSHTQMTPSQTSFGNSSARQTTPPAPPPPHQFGSGGNNSSFVQSMIATSSLY
jgi:hypothetical protein